MVPLLLSLASSGCDPQPTGPDPVLIADPPPTDDGRAPGAGNSDYDRGLAYIEKEAYAEALPHFERALEAQPDNAEALYYRGLALARTGERARAEQDLARAIELDEKLVLARLHLGALYLEDPPKPDKAVAVLEPAVEQDPKAADIREQLAFAYRLAGNKDKALAQYKQSLALQDNPDVRLGYADLLFEMGKEEEARAQMKRLVASFAQDVEKLAFVAHRLAKTKAYDDCVKAFDAAIALEPKQPGFFLHRGLCKHGLKKEKQARDDYEKALSIDGKFQPAHYYLAQSYLEDKMRGKALEHLRKAVSIDKSSAVGKKAQQELKTLGAGQ